MNIARVIEVDGAPLLLIYAKAHGSHSHSAIDGIDFMGRCVLYQDERMPDLSQTHVWLINKVQEELDTTIVALVWEANSIHIKAVAQRVSDALPEPAA